jgi:elongation factor P
MVLKAEELKPGATIGMNDDGFLLLEIVRDDSAKVRSVLRAKLKNLEPSSTTHCFFKYDDGVDQISLDKKKATFGLENADSYTFIDTDDYTIYELPTKKLEGSLRFIEGDMQDICTLEFYKKTFVSLELPESSLSQSQIYRGSPRYLPPAQRGTPCSPQAPA